MVGLKALGGLEGELGLGPLPNEVLEKGLFVEPSTARMPGFFEAVKALVDSLTEAEFY